MPPSEPSPDWTDLLTALDDELARLPDRYRAPLLACYLDGRTQDEAARQLGWSRSTLRRRLDAARTLLKERMTARGATLGGGLIAGILSPTAAPAVSVSLTRAVADHAAGASPPPRVLALFGKANRTSARAALVLAGATLSAVLVWAAWSPGDRPPAGEKTAPPATSSEKTEALAPVDTFGDPLPVDALARLGTVRFRDGAHVRAIAFAPDGKTVASAGFHARVHVWESATGKELLRFNGEDSRLPGFEVILGLAFSPDGKTLAMARINGSACLCEAATGRERHRLTGRAGWVAFAPDGKTLAYGPGPTNADPDEPVFRLADAETGKELYALKERKGAVATGAFAPDGKTLATADERGIHLFDPSTHRSALLETDAGVRSLAFSPNGKTLAASGGAPPRQMDVRTGSSTRLFDAATGKEVLKINGTGLGLQFAPDGASLVGAVAGAIYRWDAVTGRVLTPEGADSQVNQIEVTPDGARLVTRTLEGETQAWDTRTGALVRSVDREGGWGRGLALGPDGRYLAWSAPDRSVRFADPERPRRTLTGSRVRVFDLKTGAPVERFEGFEGGAHSSAFTPDGKTLVTVDHQDGTVRLWAFETGKLGRSFRIGEKRERSSVSRARLSPDGKVLAAVHAQEQRRGEPWRHAVKLWDTATGKELLALPEYPGRIETLSFSPDGKYLVTGEPPSPFIWERPKSRVDQTFVWEVATGKRVTSLPVEVTAAAFASDGKTLAVVGAGGAIQLWNTSTWALRGTFPGRGSQVTALTFGPDGRLFSGSADATILAWDTKAAKLPPAEPK